MIINQHHFGSAPAKLESMCVIVIGFIAPCYYDAGEWRGTHQCKLVYPFVSFLLFRSNKRGASVCKQTAWGGRTLLTTAVPSQVCGMTTDYPAVTCTVHYTLYYTGLSQLRPSDVLKASSLLHVCVCVCVFVWAGVCRSSGLEHRHRTVAIFMAGIT